MQYVASLSYGKDSMAMLEAIKILGLPLDRIITADVWATETIPADLPPMVEFKAYADEEIKKRYGIEVEHFWATNKDGSKRTYNGVFYTTVGHKRERERERDYGALSLNKTGNYLVYGFPIMRGAWCNSELKMAALGAIRESVQTGVPETSKCQPLAKRRHRAETRCSTSA